MNEAACRSPSRPQRCWVATCRSPVRSRYIPLVAAVLVATLLGVRVGGDRVEGHRELGSSSKRSSWLALIDCDVLMTDGHRGLNYALLYYRRVARARAARRRSSKRGSSRRS